MSVCRLLHANREAGRTGTRPPRADNPESQTAAIASSGKESTLEALGAQALASAPSRCTLRVRPMGQSSRGTVSRTTSQAFASLIWWLIGVWLASALYVAPFVDRGWVPHDEGLLGQSAERVSSGQLPHRDFDEVYTGGLSYLHALAFKLGGVRSIALRWTVFAFLLAWVPVVFWIASRSVRPSAAALVTAAAVTWSLPNYFASMPSWYNLFFATFGIAALMRHLETGRVAMAGCGRRRRGVLLPRQVCGPVLHRRRGPVSRRERGAALERPVQCPAPDASDRRRASSFIAAKAALAVVLVGAVSWLVRSHSNRVAILHFVVPVAAVCGFLVWSEIAWGRRPVRPRARSSVSARPSVPGRRRDTDRRVPGSVRSNARTRRLLSRRVHHAATAAGCRELRASAMADGAAADSLRPHSAWRAGSPDESDSVRR